jgi:hypothetical protein
MDFEHRRPAVPLLSILIARARNPSPVEATLPVAADGRISKLDRFQLRTSVGALDAACSGTAKIIIDHLERAALPVVQNLMSRRLRT